MGVTNGLQIRVFIFYHVKLINFFFPNFPWLYLVFIFKSLLEVFIELLPTTNHRCCIQHFPAHFMNNGPTRKALNEIMWDTKRANLKIKHTYCTNRKIIYEDLEKQYAKLWRYQGTSGEGDMSSIVNIAIELRVFWRFILHFVACKRE